MPFIFKGKDVLHTIQVKFINAYLPEAKKPYYLRPANQIELDISDIAHKANIYKINTTPEIIEEGFNAAVELIFYLAADGYKIKTQLFNLQVKAPGEYTGNETNLPAGLFPVAKLQTSAEFRNYIKEKVQFLFDGIVNTDGCISEITDEASGLTDTVATKGNLLTIHGIGLKIDADESKKSEAGLFFIPDSGSTIKADIIAVNEPRTLKALIPISLESGAAYTLEVVTQRSSRAGGHLLKNMRHILSDCSIVAQ